MLISVLRYNHPKLLIKKPQVLGKGFYPQIGKSNRNNNPTKLINGLVIFAALLFECAKN